MNSNIKFFSITVALLAVATNSFAQNQFTHELANYVGKDSRFVDRNKFWAQIEFKY